jgi:hypothetical protein
LLDRTSTVVADELPPAAADELPPAAAEDAGEAGADEELLEPPPELQAATRTAAPASGKPSFNATDAFLDDSKLSICCDSPFDHGIRFRIEIRLPCTAQYAETARAVQYGAMRNVTVWLATELESPAARERWPASREPRHLVRRIREHA